MALKVPHVFRNIIGAIERHQDSRATYAGNGRSAIINDPIIVLVVDP